MWDTNTLDRLRELWANPDNSMAAIARMLDTSRNAVSGKIKYLHIQRGKTQPRNVEPPPKKVRRRNRDVTLAATAGWPISHAKFPYKNHFIFAAEGTCRWSDDDPAKDNFIFCGKEVSGGKPFCAQHSSKAYLSPAEREKEHRATRGIFFAQYALVWRPKQSF